MADFQFSPPRKILVATDLSPRCDRAVDRAVQLADEFGAELIAAHIIDPAETARYHRDRTRRSLHRIRNPLEEMRWRVKRDLPGASEQIRAVVEEGAVSEKLIEVAQREECELIVTGDVSPESLNRMLFGSTVNRIVRKAGMPVLMVHDRPTQHYRNILVATDFSEASVTAFQTAAAFFPEAGLTLFHAFDMPYAGFIVDHDIPSQMREKEHEIAQQFGNDPRFGQDLKERTALVVEHGSPESLIGKLVDERDINLTVMGSHGRGPIFDALIGSNAKRLAEQLEGDLLIVRYDLDA